MPDKHYTVNTLPVAVSNNARPELPEIILRMLNGEAVSCIAKDYTQCTATLYSWLAKGIGNEGTRAIRQEVMAHRLAESESMVMQAPDKLELARAALICKRVEWLAAKMTPEIYGDKVITESKSILVNVNR